MAVKKRKRQKSAIKPRVEPRPPRMVISDYALRRRILALAECIKLYPDEVASGLAKRDEAGWCFGRLYLIGAIDMVQYSEAKKLDRVVRQYKRLLHRYGLVEAQNIEMAMMCGGVGRSGEDLSDQAIKASERVYSEYHSMYNRLGMAGSHVRDAVLDALELDAVTDLGVVRSGLNILISTR